MNPERPVPIPGPVDPAEVTLREITAETVGAVIRLAVADSQKGFVATNAVSLAQALFAPEAWYRAIYYEDDPVGFVMLSDESLRSPPPEKPGIGLWRFMIDARYQGRGIGRAALLRVIEHVKAKGQFTSLELSYVPGPGCPEPFYRSLGFRPNGRVDDGEVVMELRLQADAD
jgi:diamine N-acetyltransferase